MSNTSSDNQPNGNGNGLARHLNWSTIPVEQMAEGIQRQMFVGNRLMICRFSFPAVSRDSRARPPARADDDRRAWSCTLFYRRQGTDRFSRRRAALSVQLLARRDNDGRGSGADRHLLSAPRGLSQASHGLHGLITDQFKLDERVALVTGASTGLGAAIAIALAEAGAQVACHGNTRSPESTCDQINSSGGVAHAISGDLSQAETAERLIEQTLEALGGIDILINNAGTIRRAPAVDYSDDDWAAVIEVNLSSVFRLCKLAGRQMIERGRGGKIVNIASLLSFQGGITVPAYAASKGGVAQLTKALANEWAKHGVNVNAIAPGYMRTANTAALQADETRNRQILERIPAGRWGEPEDIAGAAVFLSSSASDYVNGHILVVDGGWMGR
jgi:2-dehydro-3-deoxy-D-gluconate 5-dehydrogenase